MNALDPRQILILLDAEEGVQVEELVARLPERDEFPQVHRFTEAGGGDLRRGRPLTPADWTRQADAIVRLVQQIRNSLPRDRGVETYISGKAPLPLFVQLGQEMSDWPSSLTFLTRRGDGTWEELPLSNLSILQTEAAPFFDVSVGLDAPLSHDEYRRVCLFVSTRAPADRGQIERFLKKQGSDLGSLVEVRTKEFRSFSIFNVRRAAEELARVFAERLPGVYPKRNLALFVAGPPVLGFLVGRALQKDVYPSEVWVPHLERGDFQPALSLPWRRDVERLPDRVTVFLAHTEGSNTRTSLSKKLREHLIAGRNSADFRLELLDPSRDIQPGQELTLALRAMLERSDIVVALLSAEFLSTELGELVQQYLKAGRKVISVEEEPLGIEKPSVIPVLESTFDTGGTPWDGLQLLPRDKKPLTARTRDRDDVLAEVARAVRYRAEELVRDRKVRIEADAKTRTRIRIDASAASLSEFLDEIERDLQALPRLRITLNQRHGSWERLIDYLDLQYPDSHLKEKLSAQRRERFELSRRFSPELQEPPIFQPDDPLGAVLELLDEQSAARWLCMGAVEVQPKLSFPSWGLGNVEEDLVARLSRYQTNDRQRRDLERSQILHQAGCPGLLAVLSRQHEEPLSEVNLALELLRTFRQQTPLPELWRGRGATGIQGAAVLNLIGAEALWRADLHGALLAYRAAQQRAEADHLALAEWVAVWGLITTLRWNSIAFVPAIDRAQGDAEEKGWERRRLELELEPDVALVKQRSLDFTLKIQGDMINTLHKELVDATGLASFGSDTSQLEDLLRDEEEIGAVPVARGEIAELLGTVWLMQTPPPGENRLLKAVELLCCYGFGDEAVRRYYSPALTPFRADFEPICKKVLQPGRTVGEWVTKVDFLDRYERDLPPSLADEAISFYQVALEKFGPHADEGLRRMTGRNYGEVSGWALLDRLVGQTLLLAGHLPNGIALVQALLDRPEPRCWQLAMEKLHILPWRPWFQLGELPVGALDALAERLVYRFQDAETQKLFAEERISRSKFYRDSHIPLGLSAILSACRDGGANPTVIEVLHRDLCRLLEVGMQREPALFQTIFFDGRVTGWLASKHDQETVQTVDRIVNCHLNQVETFRTDSTYFISLALVGENPSLLLPAHWARLTELLNRNREQLLKAAGSIEYSVRQILWLASGLLAHESHELQQLGFDLVHNSAPLPEVLVAAVAAKPERLGLLAGTIEQAVFHCLRGLTGIAMPWFANNSQKRTPQDRDNLVRQGLGAVHNYIFFHYSTPPLSGWGRWLDPALAHCYSPNPRLAVRALGVLEQALSKIPGELDLGWVSQALCWALAQSRIDVRDQALFVAIRNRSLLETAGDAGLAEAIQRFIPPPSISASWITRVASFQEQQQDY